MSDLKVGCVVIFNNGPHLVVSTDFLRMAQRKATLRIKLRNLITGNIVDYTISGSETLPAAEIEHTEAQFLYTDKNGATFMDLTSYEQLTLEDSILGDGIHFLKEGTVVQLNLYNGKPISVELPKKVELKVIEAAPGVRGDTAQGATKLVKLETGFSVAVPLFINEGETLVIDTRDGAYVERAKS